MCRWLAYSGRPDPARGAHRAAQVLADRPEPALAARATTTNGDGFGVGWYGEGATRPRLFRSVEPAWNDRNLRELASHVSSPLFFTHIRASTGTRRAADQLPPVPPRPLAVDAQRRRSGTSTGQARPDDRRSTPSCSPTIEGSTDSEVFFHLALTFGLEHDRPPRSSGWSGSSRTSAGARRRAPDPDDRGDHGRRADLGVPLLERGPVAIAALQHGRRALRTLHPTTTGSSSSRTRRAQWCRSRSATWRACGTPSPSRRSGSCSPGRTKCAPSRPGEARLLGDQAFVGAGSPPLLLSWAAVMCRPIRSGRWAS